jgi:hypothetical protein
MFASKSLRRAKHSILTDKHPFPQLRRPEDQRQRIVRRCEESRLLSPDFAFGKSIADFKAHDRQIWFNSTEFAIRQ